MRVNELVSTSDDTANAFAMQAERKAGLAVEFLNSAKVFENSLKTHDSLEAILGDAYLINDLATALGVSGKARNYFDDEALSAYLNKIICQIYSETGESLEELKTVLVSRFLLTSGDSLGGKSRNLVGRDGSEYLVEALKKHLTSLNIEFNVITNENGKVKTISWGVNVAMFDVTPRWIGKNIDIIILRNRNSLDLEVLKETPEAFVACGEVKGGADPAGSDEHWKTACSAFNRIRTAFKDKKMQPPAMFFAGLSIVSGVAVEICKDLASGGLVKAANLARSSQVENMAVWIAKL